MYRCNQIQHVKEGILRGPWLGVLTGYTQVYLYVLIISSKISKIFPTLFCDYLRSGGDILMICSKDDIEKCG